MKQIDRKAVHNLFDAIVAGESDHEKVLILKDILVDEFCFNGIEEEKNLSLLEEDIQARMTKNPGEKIACIRDVRYNTGLGLAEAKAFVESLTPTHESYGKRPNLPAFSMLRKSMLTTQHLDNLAAKLKTVAEKYGIKHEFNHAE